MSLQLRGAKAMNFDRYQKDLGDLINRGTRLLNAILYDCSPQEVEKQVKAKLGAKSAEYIKELPSFKDEYQSWYSEAKALVRQLLPDRLADFTRYYEKPKSRKEITYENYVIEDYLQGIRVTRGPAYDKTEVVGPAAAISRVEQQLSIVKSIKERFQSSLFDIHRLAQADLFDSELDAARELAKNKFTRAAGAVAGVVLEGHLKEVCTNHSVTVRSRNPQISHLNEALKDANIIEIPEWRFIQHLGDLRNLCAHNKETEPSSEQVNDLLAGVAKVTKTIF